MAHEVVAAPDAGDGEPGALQRLDYLGSRYDRDAAGHKPARYYKSGHVECQSHLVWWSDLFEQKLKSLAQVGKRSFLRRPVAERGDTRTKLGGATPDAVLVLLDDVGHVNDTSHSIEYGMPLSDPCKRASSTMNSLKRCQSMNSLHSKGRLGTS